MCGDRTYTYGCGCPAPSQFRYCEKATKEPNGSGKVACGSNEPPAPASENLPNNKCLEHRVKTSDPTYDWDNVMDCHNAGRKG